MELKENRKIYQKSYREKNKDKFKAYEAARTDDRSEYKSKYGKKYYALKKEKWKLKYEIEKAAVLEKKRLDRIARPQVYRERESKWQKNNMPKINAKINRRRASKLQATPKWLTKEHLRQIEKFYIEAATMTKQTGIKHEVDHIEPLQGRKVRGLHVPWNLQIMTKSENSRKGNRT